MIKVIEQTKGKELMYVMYIDDIFDGVTQINILYRTTECYVNDSKYYFIYDGAMNPIRESFEFLNNYYGTKSINTRTMALHALKILYSYEKIIGTKLEDFTSTDLIGFKEFLLGFCRKGKVIEFANLTERQPDTVNMYLGIYRAYLKSQGKKNQYLEESSGKSVSYISNYDYTTHKSAGYKSNVKTVTKTEIPQYISVDEFSHIISLIRKKYSKREECIIRLMYETGMRIGDDDDKIRLNQRKPSKYKGLRRFGPEKNLQRINKFMKERPIFYKNLIQMKENIRFYLRCFYCITKVMILQFNSENRTELARNG